MAACERASSIAAWSFAGDQDAGGWWVDEGGEEESFGFGVV